MHDEHAPHPHSHSQPLVREVRIMSRKTAYTVSMAGLLSLAAGLALPWPSRHQPAHSEHAAPHAGGMVLEVSMEGPLVHMTGAGCLEPAEQPEPAQPQEPIGEPLRRDGGPNGPLKGVSVSRAHDGVIAVWSESTVAVSRDGGKSFTAVADKLAGIADVAVGQGGWIYIARDRKRVMLGTLSPEGVLSWQRTPFSGPTYRLRAGAGALVWLGAASSDADDTLIEELAVSTDHGRSWSTREVYAGNFAHDIQVGEDGHIQLMAGFEASCGGGHQERQLGHVLTVAQEQETDEDADPDANKGADKGPDKVKDGWRGASWPLDVPVGWMLGAGGWAYGVNEVCDLSRPSEPEGKEEGDQERAFLCAVGPEANAEPVVAMKLPRHTANTAMAQNGDVSLAVIDSRVLRVDGAAAKVLTEDAPSDLSSVAVDASEQLFAIHRGYLVRWSRHDADGWRSLFPSRAAVAVTGQGQRKR